MSHTYSLGQQLFYEPVTSYAARRAGPIQLRPVTVVKVGRVWITVKHVSTQLRFEPEPDEDGLIWVDSGDFASDGRIWPSVEAHEEFMTRLKATEAISAAIRRGRPLPAEIPTDMLTAMAALLPADE